LRPNIGGRKMALFANIKMVYAVLLFVLGHTLGWYAHNLQFVNEYWKDRAVLSIVVFGIPSLFAFWFGTKFAMEAVPELWTARFMAAVFSYLTFPVMTWYYLDESMFTVKTMSCIFLAFLILMIQMFVE
jgi:hypothetical protein